MGIGLSLGLTTASVWFGTHVLRDYGWSLFVGLPFSMGFLSVLVYGFHGPQRLGSCVKVALLAITLAEPPDPRGE